MTDRKHSAMNSVEAPAAHSVMNGSGPKPGPEQLRSTDDAILGRRYPGHGAISSTHDLHDCAHVPRVQG
jgi:hypothetical protein